MASGYYDITTKTLGKGHYGIVKLGRHCLTGEPVAMKIIEKSRLNIESLNLLGSEIRILFRLSEYEHPNILKLYQTIDTEDKLLLVTEYCGPHACDLHDYLLRKNTRNGLSEKEAQTFFIQICSAISYCHSMGIVHRDLKPENILVTDYRHMYDNSKDARNTMMLDLQYPLLKLIDFGFANQWYPDEKMRTSCGTLAYSAPELLLGEPYDGTKVDVWGLGLMLYILLYGGNPFMQLNDNETLTKILDCSFATPTKENVDYDAVELLRSLIKRNPDTRLPIDSILRHKWFSGVPKPLELAMKYQSVKSATTHTDIELSTPPCERKLHDLVIQEMFRLTSKLMDSKSGIEASLKNARFAHRLFNQSSVKSATSQFNNDDYIYATYQLTRDRILRKRQEKLSVRNKDDDASANNNSNKESKPATSNQKAIPEEEDGIGIGGVGGDGSSLSGSADYSVGGARGTERQLKPQRKLLQPQHRIRDKFTSFLKQGQPDIMHHHEAFSDHNNETSGLSSVGSKADASAYALPLARKCSLVSEESGCSNDQNQ